MDSKSFGGICGATRLKGHDFMYQRMIPLVDRCTVFVDTTTYDYAERYMFALFNSIQN